MNRSNFHQAIDAANPLSNVTLTDPTVSNQHLLIYTIAYTEDNHQRIFVYAKDLSTNGTYWRYKHGNHWKELLIGKGSAVLLSDGDKIRLCNGSSFAFRSVHRKPPYPEDTGTIREEDTKAGLKFRCYLPALICRSYSRTFSGSQTGNWDLEHMERSGWLSIFSVNVKWLVRLLSWISHLRSGQERSTFLEPCGVKWICSKT